MKKIFKHLYSKISWFISRIWFEVLIIILLISIIFISPYTHEGQTFLMNTFIGKGFIISCGILHAHISRKLLFPYIDFNKETSWSNNIMVIVWYVTIITAWARGG